MAEPRKEVTGLRAAGDDMDEKALQQSSLAVERSTRSLPPSRTWHSAELDRIEVNVDALVVALRELWQPAKGDASVALVVACGLRAIADLHWRRGMIAKEAGL